MKLLGGAAGALLLSSTCVAVSQTELQQKPLDSSPTSGQSKNAPSYRKELVSLHKSLIDISSITYNEHEVGHFLIDYLTKLDFTAKLDFLPPSNASSVDDEKRRFNVVAWPSSSSGQRHHNSPSSSAKVLVTSHIDTVPPYIPYSLSNDDNADNEHLSAETLISGRGSVDAKASVAAQITAVTELLSAGTLSTDDVMLLYVVGEERGGDGMKHFSDFIHSSTTTSSTTTTKHNLPEIKAAIFGEPTEGKLACGHKGTFMCTITAHGKAGHSGYPWLGKSATEVLMRGLVVVLDADLGSSELYGNTTVNIGTVEGGVAPNVIPERAVASIVGRVAVEDEGEGGKIVVERVRDLLEGVDGEAFEMVCNTGYGVVGCNCDVPDFEPITVNYGTDVPSLKGSHTRYLYGPGTILVAHGDNEAITLGDLEAGVEGYKKLILHAVAKDVGEKKGQGEGGDEQITEL